MHSLHSTLFIVNYSRGLLSHVLMFRLPSKLFTSVLFSRLLISSTTALSTCAISSKMTSNSSFVTLVTCPNSDTAKKLSRDVVGNKLAACVNIIPQVISVYEWNGKMEEDEEVLMVIKTSRAQLASLISYVENNHPYDVPEVISMEITDGSKNYLDWIVESTKSKS